MLLTLKMTVSSTPYHSSTSYDRYYEGRKDFGTLVSHVRLHVDLSVSPKPTPLHSSTRSGTSPA